MPGDYVLKPFDKARLSKPSRKQRRNRSPTPAHRRLRSYPPNSPPPNKPSTQPSKILIRSQQRMLLPTPKTLSSPPSKAPHFRHPPRPLGSSNYSPSKTPTPPRFATPFWRPHRSISYIHHIRESSPGSNHLIKNERQKILLNPRLPPTNQSPPRNSSTLTDIWGS